MKERVCAKRILVAVAEPSDVKVCCVCRMADAERCGRDHKKIWTPPIFTRDGASCLHVPQWMQYRDCDIRHRIRQAHS